MRKSKTLGSILAIGLLGAACGGASSATAPTAPPTTTVSLHVACVAAVNFSADMTNFLETNDPVNQNTLDNEGVTATEYGPPLEQDVATIVATAKAATNNPTNANVATFNAATVKIVTDCESLEK